MKFETKLLFEVMANKSATINVSERLWALYTCKNNSLEFLTKCYFERFV
jgi:hypothetical protein